MRDAIVVGSGFGGAVTAARLAERGFDVLVLERGPWWGWGARQAPTWDPRQSPGDGRDFPRRLHELPRLARGVRWSRPPRGRDMLLDPGGLWEWHAFADANVLTASGVGGGSLVYTNIQERPDPDFFAAFPGEIDDEELRPYYDVVARMLRPTPAVHPPPREPAFREAVAATGRSGVERPDLAIAWGPRPHTPGRARNAAGVEQGTCVNVAECVLGCRFGAKASLDLTYVPVALQHGCELRTRCEVAGIGRARGTGYHVRYRDHRTGHSHEAIAARLILAAGTLNTVRLLLLARDRQRTLPDLPPCIGHGFSLNGDAVAVLWRPLRPTRADEGPTISILHRQRDPDGHHRLAVGEAGLPVRSLPLPRWLRRRVAGSTALFGFGRERPASRLYLDGAHLASSAGRTADPGLYRDVEAVLGELAAAYRPARVVPAPRRRPARRLLSVHPLGGAAVGTSTVDGVVDHTGQVFGHPGLYVVDGSVLPTAPGIPPSMTIAAFAERTAALMT